MTWTFALGILGLLAWHGGLHAWQVLAVTAIVAGLWWTSPRSFRMSPRLLGLAALVLLWQAAVSVQPQISLNHMAWGFVLLVGALTLRGPQRPDATWGARAFFALAVIFSVALFFLSHQLQGQDPAKVWVGSSLVAAATHVIFPNQNLLAVGVLVPAYLIGLAWVRRSEGLFWVVPGLLVITAALIYSGSRGGLLALAAGAAWWCLRAFRAEGRRGGLWIVAVLAVLTLGLMWKGPGSGLQRRAQFDAKVETADGFRYQRLKFWKASWKASLERPWLGWGLGAYAEAIQRQDTGSELSVRNPIARYRLRLEHAHNELLEAAVEWGWPLAAAAFLACSAWFWRRASKPESDVLAWSLEAALVGVAVHAMVDMPLRPPFIQLGVVLAWAWLESGEAREPRQPGARWPVAFLLGLAVLVSGMAWGKITGGGPAAVDARLQPQQWVKLRPYEAAAHLAWARQLKESGDTVAAERELDLALALEPNFVRAWELKMKWSDARGAEIARRELTRIAAIVIPEDQRRDAKVLEVLRSER